MEVAQRLKQWPLHGMNIGQQLSISQKYIDVFKTRIGLYRTTGGFALGYPTWVNSICNAGGVDLPEKTLNHGLNRWFDRVRL